MFTLIYHHYIFRTFKRGCFSQINTIFKHRVGFHFTPFPFSMLLSKSKTNFPAVFIWCGVGCAITSWCLICPSLICPLESYRAPPPNPKHKARSTSISCICSVVVSLYMAKTAWILDCPACLRFWYKRLFNCHSIQYLNLDKRKVVPNFPVVVSHVRSIFHGGFSLACLPQLMQCIGAQSDSSSNRSHTFNLAWWIQLWFVEETEA